MAVTAQPLPKIDSASLTVDPNIRGGVPCVGVGQWPIAHVLEKLSLGQSAEQILGDFPELTLADIRLALRAAAWVMREPTIEWGELQLADTLNLQDELRGWEQAGLDAMGLGD